jgi:hypothetical protein
MFVVAFLVSEVDLLSKIGSFLTIRFTFDTSILISLETFLFNSLSKIQDILAKKDTNTKDIYLNNEIYVGYFEQAVLLYIRIYMTLSNRHFVNCFD